MMELNEEKGLRPSQKLGLLMAVMSRHSIRTVLDGLSVQQLVEAHGFLWDKLVEFHYLTRDNEFVREEVTRQMTPSAVYQKRQGCDLRLDYCKGVECVWSNPECAGNKIKNNMEVMATTIGRCLDECTARGTRGRTEYEEANPWLLR